MNGWVITVLYCISSHFRNKKKRKKHIVELWKRWVGRKQTVDSNLTVIHQSLKSLPTVCVRPTPVNTKKKWSRWRFCDWFQFCVWKLACFGVDSLIMSCACVSLWPISVVLLDTTSVLGELGWKAYPINGVRRSTSDFSFSLHFGHCNN